MTARAPLLGRRPRLTLGRRLALLTTVAVVVAVAAASVCAWFLTRRELDRQVDESLVLQSRIAEAFPADAELVVSASALIPQAVPIRVQVVDDAGRVRTPRRQAPLPLDARERRLARSPGSRPVLRTIDLGGRRARMISRPTSAGGVLQLARPLDDVQETLDRLAVLLGLVVIAGAGIAALAGHSVARAGLAPVRRVADAAHHVARTADLRTSVPVEGDDEVARVAHSMNVMLSALDRARAQQRRLVEDAGHELLTPLTSLRTNIELLVRAERTGAVMAAADRAALLRDVRGQLVELSHLFRELVDLAREDSAPEPPDTVQLDELVERAASRVRRHHPHVSVHLALGRVTVTGQRGALDRAIGNLLDNAAKFSPPGRQVDVELHGPGPERRVTLIVRDRGPGISDDERDRVFERFYRSAAARAVPGSGLGLAIVRQVAEFHGGTVDLDPRPGGGTTARLVLPG